MIKGLITSLLVSMGVVSPTTNTPSFIHNQQEKSQIKRENDNHFSLIIDNNNKTYTNSQVNLGSYGMGNYLDTSTYYMKSFNAAHSVSNNYMHVIEQETIQQTWTNLQLGDNPIPDMTNGYKVVGNSTVSMATNDGTEYLTGKKLTNNLTILQITPYRWTDDNTLNLEYLMNLDLLDVEGETLITKLYISTETRLSTYVNRNSWATAYGNQTIYETITSAEFGYNYAEYTIETEIDDHRYAELSHDIYIRSGATNYIILYSYIKPYSTNTLQYWDDNNNYRNNPTMILEHSNIQGTYIPPISNIEVVDIPGLMFTILTMPFSFISTAFNLTLFPGTPYQLNISELFLGILGLLIFVWIIKKIIEAKTGGL